MGAAEKLISENLDKSLFDQWFAEARQLEPSDPNAMALATADGEGRPSVRMVLQQPQLGTGHAVSIATDGQGLRVQAVPFFAGEESGPLARTIAAEARTVWTRT